METTEQDGSPPSRTSQLFMQMMNQMSEQLQAIQREQQSLRTERETDREETRTQIRTLQSAIATPNYTSSEEIVNPTPQRTGLPPPILNVASPPPPTEQVEETQTRRTNRKKPTLPNPPKFDGTRRNFRPWHLEMRAKLTLDRDAFSNEQELFAYVYARLEGTAQNMAAAYFEQGGSDGSQSADHFLDYLNRRYGDPNAKRRALDRLRTLRQRPDESFATFFPKFEKELADSGGGSWEDAVQINYLEGALNYKLRDRLIGVPGMPTTFNEFAELLLTIGSRLDSRDYQSRSRPGKTNSESSQRQQPASKRPVSPAPEDRTTADQMDWEPTKAGKAGSGRKPSGKPTKETGPQCYSCGGYGHIARECANERNKEAVGKEKPNDGKKSSKAGRVKPKIETSLQYKDESDSESQYDTASDQESEKA